MPCREVYPSQDCLCDNTRARMYCHRRLNKLRSAFPNAVSLHKIGLTLKTIKVAVFLTTVMPVTYKYILRFKVSVSSRLMAKNVRAREISSSWATFSAVRRENSSE